MGGRTCAGISHTAGGEQVLHGFHEVRVDPVEPAAGPSETFVRCWLPVTGDPPRVLQAHENDGGRSTGVPRFLPDPVAMQIRTAFSEDFQHVEGGFRDTERGPLIHPAILSQASFR